MTLYNLYFIFSFPNFTVDDTRQICIYLKSKIIQKPIQSYFDQAIIIPKISLYCTKNVNVSCMHSSYHFAPDTDTIHIFSFYFLSNSLTLHPTGGIPPNQPYGKPINGC